MVSVLRADRLSVTYNSGRASHEAVKGVSFEVRSGEVLGLVGESGCGKSTLGRALVGLQPLSSGSVFIDDRRIREAGRTARARPGSCAEVQMIFQDPYSSLNPRMSIGDSVAEGVRAAGGRRSPAQTAAEVSRLLELVRIDPRRADERPKRFSGGQRQRVAIARALAARPRFLVADEITSALDVSVQGAVLNLLRDVQAATGVGVLFITHNLAVVRYVADRLVVMNGGEIVESGETLAVVDSPSQPYTERLLRSVPTIARSAPRPHRSASNVAEP